MAAKFKKGDRVKVMAGKDAGSEGQIISVDPAGGKLLVQSINRVTRHEKIRPARGRGGQEGGIIHKELPVDQSNVALICRNDGPTRAGFRVEPDGTKVRVCRKCEAEL